MQRRDRSSIRGDLIKGAIAGAVATWVMGKLTSTLYARQDRWSRQREDAVHEGKTAYGVAAEKAAAVVGTTVNNEQRERLGSALHWGLGIGAGAAYAVLRRRLRGLGRASGLGFGTLFWAAIDEGLVPALGLTRGPTAFPWQTHARGLAGHLTFGTVTDRTLRLLDAIA